MQLTPQQQQIKSDLEQGVDYPLTIPGLTNVVAHVQDDNTYLKFTDLDGHWHYQLKGFAQKEKGFIQADFNWRLHAHSDRRIIMKNTGEKDAYSYREYDYWPFALANPPQGIVAFGYQQALNGLLRRLPALGGNEQQFGPSLFTFVGSTITLIHFEVVVTPETVSVDPDTGVENGASDGTLAINVTHGDAPFEFQLTRPGAGQPDAWQSGSNFSNLSAGEYFIRVRDTAGVPVGAPTRYRTLTVPAAQTNPNPTP